jgi:hypothetical protein
LTGILAGKSTKFWLEFWRENRTNFDWNFGGKIEQVLTGILAGKSNKFWMKFWRENRPNFDWNFGGKIDQTLTGILAGKFPLIPVLPPKKSKKKIPAKEREKNVKTFVLTQMSNFV